MLDLVLRAVVRPAEDDLDGIGARPASSRNGARGVPVHVPVPIASSSHGWLSGRGSMRARPFPAHSMVTGT